MTARLSTSAPIARSDIDRVEALIRTIETVAAIRLDLPGRVEALADAAALRRLLNVLPASNVAGLA